MRLLVINGPNLDMLGVRNEEIYGKESYFSLCKYIINYAKKKKVKVDIVQHNSESDIIEELHLGYNKYDGIIANLGAFTHYSYAIRDALEICKCPIVEVHLSDVDNRETFRKVSVIEDIRCAKFSGQGFLGYALAIDEIMELNNENK